MQTQYNKLSNQMLEYDYYYYIKGKPLISNAEYDGLQEKLLYLEDKLNIPHHLKASNRIGLATQLNDVEHMTKMYSMHKTSDIDQLLTFLDKFRFNTPTVMVDIKYDGIACEIRYVDGLPQMAISRGDGTIGKDITRNVFPFVTLPTSIPVKGTIQIEGELVLPKTDDNKDRNLCAVVSGILLGKQVPKFIVPPVFIAYNYHHKETPELQDLSSIIKDLVAWGFKVPEGSIIEWDNLKEYILGIQSHKDKILFPADGLCIKLNEASLREQAGFTKKYPKYQIAYKWEPPEHRTIIQQVIWQSSKKGRITPVAMISPIYNNQKEFNRVNLHTINKITELNLHIGDEVIILCKGGLIPKLSHVTKPCVNMEPIQIPDNCPACGGEVHMVGKYLMCKTTCLQK